MPLARFIFDADGFIISANEKKYVANATFLEINVFDIAKRFWVSQRIAKVALVSCNAVCDSVCKFCA